MMAYYKIISDVSENPDKLLNLDEISLDAKSLIRSQLEDDIRGLHNKYPEFVSYIYRSRTNICKTLQTTYDTQLLEKNILLSKAASYRDMAALCDVDAAKCVAQEQQTAADLCESSKQLDNIRGSIEEEKTKLDEARKRLRLVGNSIRDIENYHLEIVHRVEVSSNKASRFYDRFDESNEPAEPDKITHTEKPVYGQALIDFEALKEKYPLTPDTKEEMEQLYRSIETIENSWAVDMDAEMLTQKIVSTFNLQDDAIMTEKIRRIVNEKICPNNEIDPRIIMNDQSLYTDLEELAGDSQDREIQEYIRAEVNMAIRRNCMPHDVTFKYKDAELKQIFEEATKEDRELVQRLAKFVSCKNIENFFIDRYMYYYRGVKESDKNRNQKCIVKYSHLYCKQLAVQVFNEEKLDLAIDMLNTIDSIITGINTYAKIVYDNAVKKFQDATAQQREKLADIKLNLAEDIKLLQQKVDSNNTLINSVRDLVQAQRDLIAKIDLLKKSAENHIQLAINMEATASTIDIETPVYNKYEALINRLKEKLQTYSRNKDKKAEDIQPDAEKVSSDYYTDISSIENWNEIAAHTLYRCVNDRKIMTWFMFEPSALDQVPSDPKIRSSMLSAVKKGLSGDESGIKNMGRGQHLYEIKIKNSSFRLAGTEYKVIDKDIIIFDRDESHR